MRRPLDTSAFSRDALSSLLPSLSAQAPAPPSSRSRWPAARSCAPGCAASPACAPAPASSSVVASPVASSGDTSAIGRVLDDWHDAAAKADEERYFGHFAVGGVFLGTDGKERWTVPDFRAYAHPHFAKGKAWTMRATRREVTFTGEVAWFDEDLETARLGPARGSGVLVRDDAGRWKIAQYNLSIPIPNERFERVRAVIDEK